MFIIDNGKKKRVGLKFTSEEKTNRKDKSDICEKTVKHRKRTKVSHEFSDTHSVRKNRNSF